MMGKTRQERKQDKTVYISAFVFIVFVVGGAFVANSLIHRQRTTVTNTPKQVQGGVLGEKINTGGYSVTLANAKKEPLRPGFEKITASISMQNLTSEELQVSTPLQFALQDRRGVYYSVNASEFRDELSGPLAGDASREGSVTFVVPDAQTEFSLVFVAEEGTTKKVIPLKFGT